MALPNQYKKSFIRNTKKLVKEERLSERLLSYDLEVIAEAINPARDHLFKYLGIQNIISSSSMRFMKYNIQKI